VKRSLFWSMTISAEWEDTRHYCLIGAFNFSLQSADRMGVRRESYYYVFLVIVELLRKGELLS
jgi:hypothetical protein